MAYKGSGRGSCTEYVLVGEDNNRQTDRHRYSSQNNHTQRRKKIEGLYDI